MMPVVTRQAPQILCTHAYITSRFVPWYEYCWEENRNEEEVTAVNLEWNNEKQESKTAPVEVAVAPQGHAAQTRRQHYTTTK